MLELYWGCLVGGIIFAITTIIFGDLIGDALDGVLDFLSIDGLDFIEPMTIVGGITVFGGTGILLTQYTSQKTLPVLVFSILTATCLSILVYFIYVKPMKNTENSTGFSIKDFVGRIAEVTVPIPANGCGEVLIKVGAGNTNQIAASLDGEDIQTGTRVVVGEVRDGTLYVFRYDE